MAAKSSRSKQSADLRPQFLAGDLALDFLNTRMQVGADVVDLFQTSRDVMAWLERAGCPTSEISAGTPPPSLLGHARALRENIRSLVEKRKAGRRGDPALLNEFLKRAKSYPRLVWKKPRYLAVERIRTLDSTDALLSPIAEAAAALLATADFSLVKRCEGKACVLWFCDRTRSHRRRWCSTKLCGNREKVAAYRKRLRS